MKKNTSLLKPSSGARLLLLEVLVEYYKELYKAGFLDGPSGKARAKSHLATDLGISPQALSAMLDCRYSLSSELVERAIELLPPILEFSWSDNIAFLPGEYILALDHCIGLGVLLGMMYRRFGKEIAEALGRKANELQLLMRPELKISDKEGEWVLELSFKMKRKSEDISEGMPLIYAFDGAEIKEGGITIEFSKSEGDSNRQD